MATKLDILLEQIAPSKIIDEVHRKVDNAVNSFPARKGIIENFDEFKKCLIQFACHIENNVLNLSISSSTHEDICWNYCLQIFDAEFRHGSEKTAFELARTGNEGGFYRVLKVVANGLAEKYITQWTENKVHTYWNSLSVAEKLDVPAEYIKKYGHLLPAELVEGNAERIRANFTKILIEHPVMIQKIQKTGRFI